MLYPTELRAANLSNKATSGLLYLYIYGRGGEIRTPDILLPKQARYQATLHPERANIAQIACLVKYIILHAF